MASTQKNITFNSFFQNPACPSAITYTYSVAGYSAPPSFISFNSSTLEVSVYTLNNSLAYSPWYNVTVSGSINNPNGSVAIGTLFIPIELVALSVAPTFATALKSVTMYAGDT